MLGILMSTMMLVHILVYTGMWTNISVINVGMFYSYGNM